jgi:hypothetical protein
MNEQDDPEFLKEQQEASGLVRAMGRASVKLAESPVEKKLLSKMGPNALAGAHIMRSVELMLMQGNDLEATFSQHREMVEVLHRAMADILAMADARRLVQH